MMAGATPSCLAPLSKFSCATSAVTSTLVDGVADLQLRIRAHGLADSQFNACFLRKP